MKFFSFSALVVALFLSYISAQNITQTIIQDLTNGATCAACEALLVLLQGLAHTGNQNFVNTFIALCELAKVEDDDVCQGVLQAEGPILAHDLREMVVGSHTSVLFCATIFGLCQYPPARQYNLSLPSPQNPTLSRNGSKTSGQTPLKVVHFSDIHVDLSYEVGASYNCTKPICCRPYTSADAPGNNSYPAGPYGNTHCDAPLTLEESMYAAIDELAPDAAFSLFTGDVVEGAVWLVTQSENTNNIHDAYVNRMQPTLKLVYGTAGNHEAAPVNSFPPQDIQTIISSQWVYDALSSAWSYWIGASDGAVADKYGSYAAIYSSGLKIISFNSNFYYNQNFWLYAQTMEYDPDGQLAWLIKELQASETAGQRVFIIAHMPMGSSSALYDGSRYFDNIVHRYKDTISAMFFGHTHKDEFEISYSNYSNQNFTTAQGIAYIAPAMTPTSGNPSFRVYDVDPVTYAVLDFTEYFANLSDPNYQINGPTWEPLYSAKQAYGSLLSPPVTDPNQELSPAFWHNVTELFEQDDAAFQAYYARKTRDYSNATCNASCKQAEICQLRAADAQYNCITVKPGINFRKAKRDGSGLGTVAPSGDECDPSLSVTLFQALLNNSSMLDAALATINDAVTSPAVIST